MKRFGSKLASGAVFIALLIALATSTSRAAAPPPIGHWGTDGNVEQLWVFQNGTCSFIFKGKTTVSGRCSWQGSSRGGILTITYPMPLEPGKVRYNIVWVNATTITVWGDVMHKR